MSIEPTRTRRVPRAAWIAVFVIALLLRLGWCLSRSTESNAIESLPDQREYLELGRNLLHHGTLAFVDPRFDQTVYAFRMPGYPLLIAACGGNVRAVRVTQAVLDTATVAAAALVALYIWGSQVPAFAAAVLVTLNPFLIYFSGLILSDTLYAALFVWALLLLQRRQSLAGSFLLVLGVLVRPSGLLLAIALPGLAALVLDRSAWQAIWATFIAAALLAVTLAPWAYRNHRVLNAWSSQQPTPGSRCAMVFTTARPAKATRVS